MTAFLLAALSGALLAVAFPPFGLWPAALVGVLPLLWLARRELPRRKRYLAAYCGGLVFFVGGCHWLIETSWINLVLMSVPESLAFPLFVAAVRRLRPLAATLAAPIAWTGIEVVRAHWPFNGYPWLLVGGALAGNAELLQLAELCGVFGLSFVVLLVNGALFDAACVVRRKPLVALVLVGGVAASLWAALTWGRARIAELEPRLEGGPRVALAQANIPQQLKHASKPMDEITRLQIESTRAACADAARNPFDLVCWAETMFPYPLEDEIGADSDVWYRFEHGVTYGPRESRRIETDLVADVIVRGMLKPIGASLLVGVQTLRGRVPEELEIRNSVIAFDVEGRRVGRYSKSLLVPGGEFIPLRSVLPRAVFDVVESFAGFIPSLTPGEGPTKIELRTREGKPYTVAPTICYENAYPVYTARCAQLHPDFLINFSNEGWFGASAEFDQMDAITRLRAVENRRSIVRSTNTGISAVYDPLGRRIATLTDAQGRDRAIGGFLIADVPRIDVDAPFTAHASRLRAGLLVLFFGSLLARAFFRRRAAPSYPPAAG